MSWNPVRRAALAVVAVMMVVAITPRVASAQTATTNDSVQLALGKKLFESKGLCFSCHGKRGEGLLGPTTKLAGRPFTHTDGTVAALVVLIKAGVSADQSSSKQVMPARGGSRLTDAEVEAVATYVRRINLNGSPSDK